MAIKFWSKRWSFTQGNYVPSLVEISPVVLVKKMETDGRSDGRGELIFTFWKWVVIWLTKTGNYGKPDVLEISNWFLIEISPKKTHHFRCLWYINIFCHMKALRDLWDLITWTARFFISIYIQKWYFVCYLLLQWTSSASWLAH